VPVVSHADLLEAVWDAVPEDAQPERFALRRDWLLARVKPGERVLDLGCGTGDFSAALQAHGAHPLGIDVVAEPLRRARARHPQLEFRQGALDGPLALDDNSFDVVWAGEVIEHVVDVVGWLSDVRRVLPSGGRLLATTPDHPPELLRALADDPAAFAAHFEPRADHLHFFNPLMLVELLDDLGFESVDVDSDGHTLFAQAVRARY
jgi:2-polyprenyl-3-methyl-5-hydroxy-6-metoxy-1,4-benzoquinol methylase